MSRIIAAAFAAALILSCAPTANAWENTVTCASPNENQSLNMGNGIYDLGATLGNVRKTFGSDAYPLQGTLDWVNIDQDMTPGQQGGVRDVFAYSWNWCPSSSRIQGYFVHETGPDPKLRLVDRTYLCAPAQCG